MRIKLDLKIFIFLIVFLLTNQIEIYALIMLFAVLHECGHLLAGIILKLKPKRIEFNPMGLSITFEGLGEKIPQKRILIAIAGPLVNLIFIIISVLFSLEETIIYANIILMLFNLIPIYPLDGRQNIEKCVTY